MISLTCVNSANVVHCTTIVVKGIGIVEGGPLLMSVQFVTGSSETADTRV